ncbi:MAG: hypothetical protein A2017_15660 [Lentisphaerae bacterium GWF2_44_16]|nr:MAG: hypothetical protein A2017_15660 [Lentisphaerae bacterium GWF2_44_16]
MSVTIKDIAKRADVAISTVSYVLNNKSGAIKASEETRRKIFRIASELNYSPSMMAKGLREGKTYLAGVMLGSISGSFVPEILQGIEDVLHKNNYNMIISSHENPEDCMARIDQLERKKIDGLISFSGVGLEYAAGKNIPLVSLCRKSDIDGTVSVYVDEGKMGRLAAEYISGKGHRDIIVIDGRRPKCVDAFRKILAERNIFLTDKMLLKGFSFEDGREVMRIIKKKKLKATAAFAYNDILAAGMIYEAQKQGIKIPEDISILGIDDLPVCKMVNPNITTVAQPQYEQGAKAAEILLSGINGTALEDTVLSPFIIERESFIRRIG